VIKKGFTLMEIMVVIAILAVLAAIITPVLISAKKSANETVCAGHLHQLQLAIAIYVSNNDGDGVYGDVAQMGLPYLDTFDELQLPWAVYKCDGTEMHPLILRVTQGCFHSRGAPLLIF